jgi:hypothetical protein
VRKWTKSACVVLAGSIILLIVTAAGTVIPGRPAEANTSIASYAQATLTSESVNAKTVKTAARALPRPAATWTVRVGETLSGIAAALAVPGGWPALYAANRAAIGPDPNLIHSGLVLLMPRPAAPAARAQAPARTAPPAAPPTARPSHQAPATNKTPRRILAAPKPMSNPTPKLAPKPMSNPTPKRAPRASAAPPAAGMPQWLKDILLAAGLLAATAFATEPVAALVGRRRTARHAKPRRSAGQHDDAVGAADRARIVLADHERLVITYSTQDDTVYVLTPPGEDPQVVLRAARLILPENAYEDLADHLGVPSGWPLE